MAGLDYGLITLDFISLSWTLIVWILSPYVVDVVLSFSLSVSLYTVHYGYHGCWGNFTIYLWLEDPFPSNAISILCYSFAHVARDNDVT